MDNTFSNSGSEQARAVTLPPNYRPNAEEMKLLAECRIESNMRGGAFATLMGAVAYQSIKYFNLKAHPRYGMYPKVGSAIVFGFLLGKLTAIPSCYQKFKDIPNSPIGALLRQKQGGLTESLQLSMDTSDTSSSFPVSSSTQYNDSHMNSAIDIDVYNSPSSMDSYTGNELNGPESSDGSTDQNYVDKSTVSYAELRKRNREEYSRGDRERYNSQSSVANDAPAGPPMQRPSPAVPFEEKTKYGDVWG